MKKLISTLFIFTLTTIHALSQNKVLIGAAMDVYRTDIPNPFQKYQFGMEANFFISKNICLGGGMEIWSDPNLTFVTAGARLYPVKPLFLRLRGLIRDDFDLSAGAGYDLPLGKKVWGEFTSDYYFQQQFFAIRAGVIIGF